MPLSHYRHAEIVCEKSGAGKRGMRMPPAPSNEYAVNLCDLTKLEGTDYFIIQEILLPVTRGGKIVPCERRHLDGDSVLLECDEARAEAICKLIRSKWEKAFMRCYYRKKGTRTWKRI